MSCDHPLGYANYVIIGNRCDVPCDNFSPSPFHCIAPFFWGTRTGDNWSCSAAEYKIDYPGQGGQKQLQFRISRCTFLAISNSSNSWTTITPRPSHRRIRKAVKNEEGGARAARLFDGQHCKGGHDWVGAYVSLAPATWRCREKVESGVEGVGTKTTPSCHICFQRMCTIQSMGWLRLQYDYVAVSTNTLLLNREAQNASPLKYVLYSTI